MSDKLRMALFLTVSFFVLIILSLINGSPSTNTTVDVSWPNCKTDYNTQFRSGIVGVTGGLDFTRNKCLAQENSWFSNYSLYINTGYPGKSYGIKYAYYPLHCAVKNYNCLAYNYGYNAAQYAINYSYSQNAHSSVWWLDVETDNSWTSDPLINRYAISGEVDALRRVPFLTQIGIYSTASQWNLLTGSWHNKLPIWIGTGSDSKKVAEQYCKASSFTSGPVLLSQFTKKLDFNIYCK